ncbi:MAG TPA: hypothetical protein VI731_03905, partial [Bacteroidia bacterium]|nr:hypothetical protein [Bacteroidia bacterium]
MSKRFFISESEGTAAPAPGSAPPRFMVLFDGKHVWEGKLDPVTSNYVYSTSIDALYGLENTREVSEEDFFKLLGKKAIAVRHFLAAYTD